MLVAVEVGRRNQRSLEPNDELLDILHDYYGSISAPTAGSLTRRGLRNAKSVELQCTTMTASS